MVFGGSGGWRTSTFQAPWPWFGRGSHGRAHQVGATTRALSTFEVAVAGSAALAGIQAVGVHGQTHGTTRLTPFETSRLEDLVQTFTLSLFLPPNLNRARPGQALMLPATRPPIF